MNFCLIRTLARAGWLLLLLSTLMSEAQEPRKLDDTPWAGSTRGLSEPDLPAGLFADLRPNTFTVIGPSSTFLKTAGPTSLQRPRSHLVRVDLLRLAAVRDEVRSRGQVRLPLNLFADVTLDAVIERTTETRSGYTLSGVVDGDPMSSVVLVINDAVVAGMVNSVKGTWLIESRGAGVVEIRRSKGTFQCDVRASAESVMPVRQRTALAKSANQDDGDEIDVLVLFTAAARNRQGGYEGMRAHIDLWVASANEAYRMSGAVQRINLVAVVEVDYQESLESLYTDYYFLYDKNDGHMDEIHNLRDSYAADLVCLVIDNPIAGGGGVAGSPLDPSMDPDIAFAVVEVEDDPSTFAHELGHLMGLKHDRYVLIYYGGSDRLNKPFAYAHGYVNQRAFDPGTPKQSRWRTIMAYPTQIVDVTGSTNIADNQQIMRFSNPKQFHHGDPLGVPGDDPSEAVDGPADAVRTLNNTRSLVANYRQRADACRFTLSETKRTVDQAGTSFSVNVEGAGRCSYLAWSTNDFLTLSKESGSGGDEMVVRVAPNAGGARTGYVIVAGETLTINQSGAGSFLSVCKRTPIVAGKLMALTNRLKCEDVTEFDLLNIGSLDLTSQGIAALTSEDFDGLWNLRELNLSNNRFSRLPEGVFDDLTSLNRLEIQGIELFDQLPATAFDALSELTSLSLNLPLKRIERGTFDRLTSLRVLDLGHCQLRSLPDDLFANLTELNYLYLQGNQFEEIPRALHGLDNLYTLMLSTNPLKTLPANAFAGLPELWSLYLSNTSLSSIAKDAFSGLANLQRLYLQNERMYLPNNEILWFENKNEIKDLSASCSLVEVLAF